MKQLWGCVPDGKGDVHTMPIELPEHDATNQCPCDPTVYYVHYTGARVWSHRRWQEVAVLDTLSAAVRVASGEVETG